MKKLINFYINEERNIKEAMSIIQGNMSRCVVVVNKANKVTGIFSEGDVLRTILKGRSIYTPLKEVVNRKYHFLKKSSIKDAYRLVKKVGIMTIPVIDENLKLKDIITISDILKHSTIKNEKSK